MLSGKIPTPVLLLLEEARGRVSGLREHRQHPTAPVSRQHCEADLTILPFENLAL